MVLLTLGASPVEMRSNPFMRFAVWIGFEPAVQVRFGGLANDDYWFGKQRAPPHRKIGYLCLLTAF